MPYDLLHHYESQPVATPVARSSELHWMYHVENTPASRSKPPKNATVRVEDVSQHNLTRVNNDGSMAGLLNHNYKYNPSMKLGGRSGLHTPLTLVDSSVRRSNSSRIQAKLKQARNRPATPRVVTTQSFPRSSGPVQAFPLSVSPTYYASTPTYSPVTTSYSPIATYTPVYATETVPMQTYVVAKPSTPRACGASRPATPRAATPRSRPRSSGRSLHSPSQRSLSTPRTPRTPNSAHDSTPRPTKREPSVVKDQEGFPIASAIGYGKKHRDWKAYVAHPSARVSGQTNQTSPRKKKILNHSSSKAHKHSGGCCS